MSDQPWFKFYIQDWLTGTGDLTATEKGVYITLLACMYDMGGPIKRDDARLAMRCGSRISHFRSALTALLDAGKITEANGYLSNTRVEKEQVVYHELSKKNRTNALIRWGKTEQNQSSENATASISQCQIDAIQKSESESEEIDKSISIGASPKPKRAKPRTSMAEDRQPDERDRVAATEAGLTDEQFRAEWRSFRNHHIAKGSLMADWSAAWRTWLGNYGKFNQPRDGPSGLSRQRGSAASLFFTNEEIENDRQQNQIQSYPENSLLIPFNGKS